MRLGDALRRTSGHAPFVVPYLLVDRRRRRTLPDTIRRLKEGGASAVELGFPFSDPIADGPVLEAASGRSLAAGTDWADLLAAVEIASCELPTAVMTYANPVWSRGLTAACGDLHRSGATGLIVPDLSWEESAPWRAAARASGVDLVQFAAPGTASQRVADIARGSRGFLYLVSRYGTTGGGGPGRAEELDRLVVAAHRAAPRLSVLVGFGVRDRTSSEAALESGADGVIVGTALEEQLAIGRAGPALSRWLRQLRPPADAVS